MPLRRPATLALAATIAVLLCAALFGVNRWAKQNALSDLIARERPTLALYTENVRGWLGRFRSLAPTYAHNLDVVALLKDPGDTALLERVNERLERWNAAAGSSDTYILDRTGKTLAASNWNSEISFVGTNYGFRPYFKDAMQGRLGRYFAQGASSGLRGYFFAYPVQDGGPAIGAVVVKIRVGTIEQELRASPNEVFVTDDAGIIVLAGHPRWRLKTLGALADTSRQRITANRQFDLEDLQPVEIDGVIGSALRDSTQVFAQPDRSDDARRPFMHLSQRMTVEGWTMHLLARTEGATRQALTTTLLFGTGLLAVLLAAFAMWQRRRRFIERLAVRERAQRMLEATVAERTVDLRQSNDQLAKEVVERRQAETDLRQTQSELVQAGKLAALGQMSTALSHEFNQPLAAIRTYAENANAFIDRGQTDQAEDNLRRISRLTERMAQLSKHLTAFARKPKDTVASVSLRDTMDETLELLRARIDASEVTVDVQISEDIVVIGGQTRLQHVFMNLIGNAMDATAASAAPQVSVRLARAGEMALVTVEDNGTGIDPDDMDKLFDPFFTRKDPGKGLGLGLSISFNIVRDFGGMLTAENREEGGARFTVTLKTVDAAVEAAE